MCTWRLPLVLILGGGSGVEAAEKGRHVPLPWEEELYMGCTVEAGAALGASAAGCSGGTPGGLCGTLRCVTLHCGTAAGGIP